MALHQYKVSDKQVTSVNWYLTTDDFSDDSTIELFKWATTSKQAKEKDFPYKVQACKIMLVKTKQLVKEKKNARAM